MEKIYDFNKHKITFTLDKSKNMMVNATEMAKVYDAKVEAFMRNDNTKAFVKEALKSENSRFEDEFSPEGKFQEPAFAGSFINN